MDKKKVIVLICFFLPLIAAGIVGGLYVGGFALLKITKIDLSYLHMTLLLDAAKQFAPIPSAMKFVQLAMLIAVLVALVPFALLIAVLVGLREKEELHGSARFATARDLEKSGLLPTPQESAKIKYPYVIIGRYQGKYLKFSGQQFISVAAPTRSGKGVGMVIPNLLNYPDSVVTLDIKLENFFYSAGYRKQCGQDVFLFSPDGYSLSEEDKANGILRSHGWNPLFYIRRNPIFRDGDVMVIGKILYPTTGGENDMFQEAAANLLTARKPRPMDVVIA